MKKNFISALALTLALSSVTPVFAQSQSNDSGTLVTPVFPQLQSNNSDSKIYAKASWDGSFKHSYVIEKKYISGLVGLSIGALTSWVESRFKIDSKYSAPVAAAISAYLTDSVAGDIEVTGTTYYRWIKFPISAHYRAESKIKIGGKEVNTFSHEWDATADHGGDFAPDPVIE
ncbi:MULTISPECIES: hypothetical protein [Brevibacillus]|uniref:Uncharacterized protein n=1 Tax=Brevibacillus laterosporus TaxID=1465 RepID=A0AAP8QC19_BRELA|nr:MULTISPECIES: hypothetical protein [Brevibacillus]MBG9790395.1 hypothetical protein [Brevibacillus laterosporus]MCR8982863.1 hypothetical protein [Brevibacillus laterosporus]MCZ0810019.1 hypothetical protein [Brevibacillus laterosporus]MCZ0828622.1 hypothetical protein [Brevibacillus laterosporus]MCZ0852688.1 hypothetical protein [Brevibacillus laterosporus]